MIKGYRFISGDKVSRLFRTAEKAKKEAVLSGMPYPLFVARYTDQRCYSELFVRTSPAAEWAYMRNGLNRGPVTTGAVVYRKDESAYIGYRFEVPFAIWGDDFYLTHFASKPNRRMLRKAVKGLKAWYLEFNGEPIAEGE